MELMLPLIRADFMTYETYEYTDMPPLGCPLTAFGGLRDAEAGREELKAWREHTTGPFRVKCSTAIISLSSGSKRICYERSPARCSP